MPQTRRDFLKRTGAAAAGALGAPLTASAAAPERPNIVVIMADDMGFADAGCYGGEIRTPNIDSLAENGVRFTQAYSNAKCAPTRASLLTGLYSQQVGCHGGPVVMRDCVTIAEVLKSTGYRTYMTGKWHAQELPVERGFDRYYGLCDGCCNFFNPGNRRPGEPEPAHKGFPRKWAIDDQVFQPFTPEDPDFYTTDAFTDHALTYLDQHERKDPFFLYLAYTAPHYPLHAPPEDIERYRGRYRIGWDELRRRRHARQVEMGLIDEGWDLAPRDERVPAWENVEDRAAWDLDALQRPNNRGLPWENARSRDKWDLRMAVYAAMVDRMDQNIGRVVSKLRQMGQLDNTLILFLSDNGGCAELCNITQDVLPGPVDSYRSVDPPWANAQNTPFRKYKRWDHEGGISSPFIAHWPDRIKPGITHQVAHLVDIMATCVDESGAEYPTEYSGRPVKPLEGLGLGPVFDGKEREGHETIGWQFGGSRAVRQGKWKLVQGRGPWELFDMEADRTEMHDLAAKDPQRVKAMTAAWERWAGRVGAKERG